MLALRGGGWHTGILQYQLPLVRCSPGQQGRSLSSIHNHIGQRLFRVHEFLISSQVLPLPIFLLIGAAVVLFRSWTSYNARKAEAQ